MKVALVGPELEENLALRYLHAAVERAGHAAEIYDFHAAEQIPDLVERIAADRPEVVGLSMVFTARAREFISLAERLRGVGYRGHVTAGGHFASFHARDVLEDHPAIDSIIHGEGEEAIVELIENLERPGRVTGLTWRDADGQIQDTPRRANLDDLDSRALPTRPDAFQDYFGLPIANMLGSRGCYGNCHFCSINAWHRQNGGKRFRQRDVRHVAREMAGLYHDHGVRIYNFHDDNFFLPGKQANLARLGELKGQLDALRVGQIALQVKARPDSVDSDVIARLKQIGLFRVFLGVETNAVSGLKTLGRGTERRQNHQALRVLARHGIHTCFNLLMFDPEARLADLWENIRFMRRHARFPLNFCRVEVYAGTEIERRLRHENRLLGSYFGRHYRIAAENVQLAYEMFREIFTPRNFTPAGANHLAMAVDYEFHLLRHFYPTRADGRLEKTVKGLVARLNLNSAELLGRICRLVGAPRLPSQGRVEELTAELADRRATFDDAMAEQVRCVRSQIWETGTSPSPARRGMLATAASVAAVAGVCSATLALGMPADQSVPPQLAPQPPVLTPPCEMIPRPLPPDFPTHPAEMVPSPLIEATVFSPQDTVRVRRVVDEKYIKTARTLAEPLQLANRSLSVQLVVDKQGKTTFCRVEIPDARGKHAEYCRKLEQIASLTWRFPAMDRTGTCTFTLNLALPELPPEQIAKVKTFADARCLLATQQDAAKKWLAGSVASVYLELNKRGKVTRCTVQAQPGPANAPKPSEGQTAAEREKQLLAIIRPLRFPGVTQAGHCTILLGAKLPDVLKPGSPIEIPNWHMCELAPRHLDLPDKNR
ncbi:MAG: B12-binding domain-containing radical SAM protein [Candidatus Nealsonbacteria bacterium]|nr:B12-binding domain-containing radical SAM protein [Candidatus Nealsonbacteria bacterium]